MALCWHPDPVPALMICKCCVYIACFATALVYTNRSLAALLLLLLLLCLPVAANFYIVVSQDVVICSSAVVLEMHACVGAFVACYSHQRHQHECVFYFLLCLAVHHEHCRLG